MLKTADLPADAAGPHAKENLAVGVRHQRRPLSQDEFDRLLAAARAGKRFRKLSGPDRAMLYTVAAHTGVRAASPSPASFALEAASPTLTVEVGYSKHRRKDTAPVHPELAAVLRPWLTSRPADAPCGRASG